MRAVVGHGKLIAAEGVATVSSNEKFVFQTKKIGWVRPALSQLPEYSGEKHHIRTDHL